MSEKFQGREPINRIKDLTGKNIIKIKKIQEQELEGQNLQNLKKQGQKLPKMTKTFCRDYSHRKKITLENYVYLFNKFKKKK